MSSNLKNISAKLIAVRLSFLQIGLVAFNDKAEAPGRNEATGTDCYGDQLATALPENIEFLKSFVQRYFLSFIYFY